MIENRNQLIGLLSTTKGYKDKHPEHAAEILDLLDAVGLCIVPREPTREMWAAGGDAVVGYKQRHHDKVVEGVWSAMLSTSPAVA
ncbi:MAG: hypothetical protein ACRYGG_01060 [Janthinobacterium lividum]